MGASVTCCQCGGEFDERELRGSWLNRRCPSCGRHVSERLYDDAARALVRRQDDAPAADGGERLRRLAVSRYYTSEWFQLARMGQGSDAPGKGIRGMDVGYDGRGRFRLVPAAGNPSPEGVWGMSAEYRVFDALREEIIRKRSPLHGALLIPNLTFPWLPGQKPKQWGARCRGEMDCLLLHPACAVVVEVKRRSHRVTASAGPWRVKERTAEGSPRSAMDVVEQVTNGMEAFDERQRLYPRSRIFRMVVYVDPLSFSSTCGSFRDGLFVGQLGGSGEARFLPALRRLVDGLDAAVDGRDMRRLGADLLKRFGNTYRRPDGRIYLAAGGRDARHGKADAMLQALEARAADPASPLFGARVLRDLTCEVNVRIRDKKPRLRRAGIAALLLTRSHAVLIDVKDTPVHVNTHASFATVYLGDPKEGARRVADCIKHDWDLESIHYRNRSGTLTFLTLAGRSVGEVGCYREQNRVCTMNVYLNPASFHSNCDDFKQRAFTGYWMGDHGNVIGALERLAASAEPIMDQGELDRLAQEIAQPAES